MQRNRPPLLNELRARRSPESTGGRGDVALRLLLLVYTALAVMYARVTPAWQAPDEPAHYNYVVHVAERGVLPELRPGDYPAEYLEQIKAARFPPDMSIDPIRYESHQPPLYYVLASFVYWFGDKLVPQPLYLTLRLFSVVIGALALLIAYSIVHALYPDEPAISLGAAAFWGTLPMHLSMVSAINNDVLSELLLGYVAFKLVSMRAGAWSARRAVGLGAALGLALLVKFQSYAGVGVALVALAYDVWTTRSSPARLSIGRALRYAALMMGTALLIVSPWLVRNVTLYGLRDPFGLVRHAEVVMGQLTTAEYIAQHGWVGWMRAFVQTTFHSFWGQFGWMGVPLPTRVYQVLGVLSTLTGLGLIAYLVRLARRKELVAPAAARGLLVLAAWAGIALLGYLWWNTQYVQHQGRYLFPALVAWGTGFALGLREIVRRSCRLGLIALGVAALGLLVAGLFTGDIAGFGLALLVASAALLALGHWVETRRPGAALVAVYAGMAVFAAACLFIYIVPALAL